MKIPVLAGRCPCHSRDVIAVNRVSVAGRIAGGWYAYRLFCNRFIGSAASTQRTNSGVSPAALCSNVNQIYANLARVPRNFCKSAKKTVKIRVFRKKTGGPPGFPLSPQSNGRRLVAARQDGAGRLWELQGDARLRPAGIGRFRLAGPAGNPKYTWK